MVEDANEDQLVHIYGWVHIAGLLAAFFAPLAGIFVVKFEVVHTMRILYLIAFVMMTSKFIILYIHSTETEQGSRRMEESKNESVFSLLGQYGSVFKIIIKTPETLLTLVIMLVMNICNTVNTTFWPLFITEKIGVPVKNVSLFHFMRSATMLIIYFVIIPRVNTYSFKRPLLTGFSLFILSQLLLISTPTQGYAFLIISTLLEAFSLSLINPLMDSLAVITVNPMERARIISILHVIMIGLTSPFGWIAGILSEKQRILPFVLNIVLFIIGLIFTYYLSIVLDKKSNIDVSNTMGV